MRRRDVLLGGLAAAAVSGGWRSNNTGLPRYSAPFTGTVRNVGAGQTYATIAAAQTAASDGDKILCFPDVARESLTISKNVWLDFSACTWDFNGVASSTLTGGGLGAICVSATNALISPGVVTGIGLDLTSGDLTSAVRIVSATGTVVVYGGTLLRNQCGIGSNAGTVDITVDGTKLLGNGLHVNTGGLTHNAYFGEVLSVTLINVDSRAPYEAHAMKTRGARLYAIGGFYESPHGACFDMPEGGIFKLEQLTMQKLLATTDDEKFLNYATENTNQGFSNANEINNCVLDLQLVTPCTIHTLGGNMTFRNSLPTGIFPTWFGGGGVSGLGS